MQAKFDSASSNTAVANNTITVSKTSAGGNRLGLVALSLYQANKPDNPVVTWGGVAMTFLAAHNSDYAANRKVIWYYIKNPPESASDVVFSWDTNAYAVLNVMTFKDVELSSPFGVVAKSNGDSGTITVDVASDVGDLIVDSAIAETGGETVGSGQTEIFNNGAANYYGVGSYQVATTTTTTMDWAGTNVEWYQMGVAIKGPSDPTTDYLTNYRPRKRTPGAVSV